VPARALKQLVVGLAVMAALVADPTHAAIYGLLDTSELYSSANGGVTWSIAATLPASDAVGLAAGASASELFVVTRSGTVYRSSNAGASWAAAGAVTAADVASFTVNYDASVLVLTESGILYRSTNGGAEFAGLAALTASNLASIARGPLGRLYVLARSGEVYESQNQGVSWAVVGNVTVSNAVSIGRKGSELYLLTETGETYRSTNYGRAWLPVGSITASNMRAILDNGSMLLAAAETGEVYTSSDGTAWSAVGAINQAKLMSLGTDTPLATGVPIDEVTPSFMARVPYPNPTTGISGSTFVFVTTSADWVRLELFDVRGRRVGELRPDPLASAGVHEVQWRLVGFAAGTYLVRLTTGSGHRSVLKWSIVE